MKSSGDFTRTSLGVGGNAWLNKEEAENVVFSLFIQYICSQALICAEKGHASKNVQILLRK